MFRNATAWHTISPDILIAITGNKNFHFFLSLTFLLKQICKKADLCYIIIKSMIVQNESEKSEYRK